MTKRRKQRRHLSGKDRKMSANNDNVLRFKSRRKRISVVMEDDDGQEQEFTLREFNDTQRDEWMEFVRERGMTSEEAAIEKSTAGLQSELVSRCLYDPQGELVTLESLRTEWPATVVTALFMKSLDINGLTKEALDQAKNA
jgi:hypothetical protein